MDAWDDYADHDALNEAWTDACLMEAVSSAPVRVAVVVMGVVRTIVRRVIAAVRCSLIAWSAPPALAPPRA